MSTCSGMFSEIRPYTSGPLKLVTCWYSSLQFLMMIGATWLVRTIVIWLESKRIGECVKDTLWVSAPSTLGFCVSPIYLLFMAVNRHNIYQIAFYLHVFECRYLDQYFMNSIQTFCGCTLYYHGEECVSDFSSRP